jgi:hypothetical protein
VKRTSSESGGDGDEESGALAAGGGWSCRATAADGRSPIPSVSVQASARPMKRRAMDAWILYQHEPEV